MSDVRLLIFISNMVNMKTKNIIIPLIDGTGSIVPIMIIFCIRDSLREYKSNYVILSNMKTGNTIIEVLSIYPLTYKINSLGTIRNILLDNTNTNIESRPCNPKTIFNPY